MSLTAKLALAPVLVAQGLNLRRTAPRLPEPPGPREGNVGRGPAQKLLVTGDSSAAGVGVAHQSRALAAPLARYLAEEAGRRVHWRLIARSSTGTPAHRRPQGQSGSSDPLLDAAARTYLFSGTADRAQNTIRSGGAS